MARIKNALTSYFVGARPETGVPVEGALFELADWITTIDDETDENVEDQGYYSGDGTPENDVISIAEGYSFEGMYDDANEAMKFIADRKRLAGQGRKIWLRKVESNGDIVEGPATVTDIIASGGDAVEYATFSCTITFDNIAAVTVNGTPPLGV